MDNKRNRWLALLNIVMFLMVITTNYLAVTLPLNGNTTGALSAKYPNQFTPAGFTFSIWGIIYLFLAVFIVYQAVALFKNAPAVPDVKNVSPYFIANCFANVFWLFAWHYGRVELSVVFMLIILTTLILIHQKLQLALPWKNIGRKFCLDVPFSLYLGWISVATIANITAMLVAKNIYPPGLPALACTASMIAIATMLALLMLRRKHNIFFALVVCWALFGILSKHKKEAGPASENIILICQICMGVITLGMLLLVVFLARRKGDQRLFSGQGF